MQKTIDFESLDREICPHLVRIGRLKTGVRCVTVVVYSAVLCWFAYCVSLAFFNWPAAGEPTASSVFFVLAVFAVFGVLHFSLMYGLTALNDMEVKVMRKVLHLLFPDAVYSANGKIPRSVLVGSALFEMFDTGENPSQVTGYGSITFCGNGCNVSIYDVGVTSDEQAHTLQRLSGLGSLTVLYRLIVRPIFGASIESAQHRFRGMFGMHVGSQWCKGNVILLPDCLESKIGYLAHSIQNCRLRNGARHVILEDAEFENLFAVYADDEVEARKMLTPAMMRRITMLRMTLGKELMMSFSENKIYYAVPFSGGFLRLSRESLKEVDLFKQIFHEINWARNLPADLA